MLNYNNTQYIRDTMGMCLVYLTLSLRFTRRAMFKQGVPFKARSNQVPTLGSGRHFESHPVKQASLLLREKKNIAGCMVNIIDIIQPK